MQIVPTKNGPALIGYYTAVFSLIPCLALLLGPIACICGYLGLKKYNENPEISGKAHAWVALILGGLTFIINAVILGLGMFS